MKFIIYLRKIYSIYLILISCFIISCNNKTVKSEMLSIFKNHSKEKLIDGIELGNTKNENPSVIEKPNIEKSLLLINGYIKKSVTTKISNEIINLIERFSRISVLFMGGFDGISLYSSKGNFLKKVSGAKNITEIKSNSNYIVTNSNEEEFPIKVWNFNSNEFFNLKLKEKNNRICFMDGNLIIVSNTALILYNLYSKQILKKIKRNRDTNIPYIKIDITCICKYNDNNLIIGTNMGLIEIYDLDKESKSFKPIHTSKICCIRKMNDETIVSADLKGGFIIWNPKNFTTIKNLPSVHRGGISDIIKISDSLFISGGKNYGEIRLINLNSFDIEEIKNYKYNIGFNFPIKLTKISNILISVDTEGNICFWDLNKLQNIELIKIEAINDPIISIHYSEMNFSPMGILKDSFKPRIQNDEKIINKKKNKSTNEYIEVENDDSDDSFAEGTTPTRNEDNNTKSCCIVL